MHDKAKGIKSGMQYAERYFYYSLGESQHGIGFMLYKLYRTLYHTMVIV